MNKLQTIVDRRIQLIASEKANLDLDAMLKLAHNSRVALGVIPAFERGPAKLIAEIKCASPSAGTIATLTDESAVALAEAYLANGATMISVLTEPDFFGGSDRRLQYIRRHHPAALILMKDFIVDLYQIAKARAIGADAILLIAAILTDPQLAQFYQFAVDLGLTPIVEVHNLGEMRRAEAIGAGLIGINNRDLSNFKVSLRTSAELYKQAVKTSILISESGFRAPKDVTPIAALGFSGFLIGEALMRSASPGSTVRSFVEAMAQ